jgi:hypothetical protein
MYMFLNDNLHIIITIYKIFIPFIKYTLSKILKLIAMKL